MIVNQTNGYTVSAAARLLNVSRLTVYHWIEKGKLIPVRTPTRLMIPHAQVVNILLKLQ